MHLISYHIKKLGRAITHLLGRRNVCPSLLKHSLMVMLALFESASWSPCHSNHKDYFTIQKFFLEPVHCKCLGLEWRYTGQWKIRASTAKGGPGIRIKMLLILSPLSSLTCISHEGLEKRLEWGGIVLCWPYVHGPFFSSYKSSILLSPGMMNTLSSAKFLRSDVSIRKDDSFCSCPQQQAKNDKNNKTPQTNNKKPYTNTNLPPKK